MSVKIEGIEKRSPAARAGIKTGDILLKINSNDIVDVLDYRFYQNETKLELEVLRSSGKKKTFKIKKDEYYAPSKKTVLAFAIALELTLDETKDLLRSAGYALSRSSKFDIIVVYFLENRNYNMFDINEVLYEYDQPIFE